MAIELNIKAEDIDALVRDAVLKAGFGKLINDTIASMTQMSAYNSPVKVALEQFIRNTTAQLLETMYKDQVIAAITTALTTALTQEQIDSIAARAAGKISEAIARRDW